MIGDRKFRRLNNRRRTVIPVDTIFIVMENFSRRTFANDLQLSISWCTRDIVEKVMPSICALLNSGGGRLWLQFEEELSWTDIDGCLRMIEQRVRNITSVGTVSDLIVAKSSHEFVIVIPASCRLVTLNHNIYLPDECEVVSLPPSEPVETIKNIIQGRTGRTKQTQIASHCKRFVLGEDVGFGESKNTQLKLVKAESSKHLTVAKRISSKSNKLASYVSGFANHSGGHIYYGVDRQGVVRGEKISEKDEGEIIREVGKVVCKMVWPESIDKPKRGREWDVFFESVLDNRGRIIPSVFVVIIFIAHCPGGVFTEESESYHVVKGQVKKLSFSEWLSHFQESSTSSSSPMLKAYTSSNGSEVVKEVSTNSVDNCKNENRCKKQFSELPDRARTQHPESSSTRFTELYEEIIVAHKKRDFEAAEYLLGQFESFLGEAPAKESNLWTVTALYLRSCVKSAQGNYKESYMLCQIGLEEMKSLGAEIITVQFYLHAAMLVMILFCRDRGFGALASELIRKKAQDYLRMAMEDANELQVALKYENASVNSQQWLVDLQRKINIYVACVDLRCSLSGEAVQAKCISPAVINKADEKLKAVRRSVTKEHPLSHYRKIQLLFAECDLSRRRQCNCPEDSHKNLIDAKNRAEEARSLAQQHHLKQMIVYADKRLKELERLFVSHSST